MKRIAIAVVLCASLASAQEDTRYGEAIEVRLINVDVAVTGPDGKPLANLKREDFELYEDGKRVEITHFSPIVEGRLDTAPPAAAAAPDAPPPAPVEEARRPLTWAVFVDQTNIRPGPRNDALRHVRTFLEKAMASGDGAIVGTADGNAFRVRGTVTHDKTAFFKTLEGLQRERINPGPAFSQEILIRSEIDMASGNEGADTIANEINVIIESESARTRNTIRGLESFLDLLTGTEGRVAVVYVGAGFKTLPAMGVTELWRRKFPLVASGMLDAPKPEDKQSLLRRDVTRLLERMLATRVTMYTINIPDSGPIGPIASGGSTDPAAPVGDVASLVEAGSVREMAERSGGLTFKAGPQLAQQLDAVAADLSHYYSLGYRPAGNTRSLRDLRVKVNVPGARVRYREAVRERTPEEQAGDSVVAALFRPQEENPLRVTVEVEKGKGKTIPIRVRVPLQSLTFLREGDVHRGGLMFHFAVAAPNGTVWKLESRELPLEIKATEFRTAYAQSLTYSAEVPVRERGLRLAVSVMDRVGQVRSVVTLPLGGT